MNKLNPFPARTAPFPLVLLSNLFIAFEAAFETILLTKPCKSFILKEIARSATTFYLIYLTKNQEIHMIKSL